MMSDVRYEIKNFITCYLTWKFDTKKSGLVRTQRTNNWSWLIRLKMKRFVHGLILFDNARSKENGRILTLIRSTLLSIITFYIGYGNRINLFKYFQCDHGLTSFCQSDLQEASKLALKFLTFEGWKIFLQKL